MTLQPLRGIRSRLFLILGLLLTLGSFRGTAAEVGATLPHWTLSGSSIKGPDGTIIHLRGFDVCWWVPPTDQDAVDIQQLGANCVRYMFGYNPKGAYDPAQVDEVKRQIQCFTSRGIWVIPVLYLFEKPDPADPKNPKKRFTGPWSTPEMNQEFLAMWTDLMGQLKDDPHIAAWEPINEPHDTPPATVVAWYREIIPTFRAIDPVRPIVVEGANYSHAEDLTDEFKMDDSNIIYAFHMYNPFNYTTDLRNPPLIYPGPWGRAYLDQTIQPALRFREKYQVPVWCGEWGVKTEAPGYQQWLRDSFAVMESNKLDWCIWAWALQPKDPQNQSFDINKQKPEVYRLMVDLFSTPSLNGKNAQP